MSWFWIFLVIVLGFVYEIWSSKAGEQRYQDQLERRLRTLELLMHLRQIQNQELEELRSHRHSECKEEEIDWRKEGF